MDTGRPSLLPLSTHSAVASNLYWQGVAALVGGLTSADELLGEALAVDPSFFLAAVATATVSAIAGRAYVRPTMGDDVLRGERQHAEIVAAHFSGRVERATALRREHLLEYPGDLLVGWLVPTG